MLTPAQLTNQVRSVRVAYALRRTDSCDADMESDRDRDDSNFDIIDNEDYEAKAETADATKPMGLSSFEEDQHHQYQPHQVGLFIFIIDPN